MRIDITSPGQRFDASRSVCIVVDVLRASSTIVTLLERGCERVVAAANVAEAKQLHERLPQHLLCGEAGGLPPEGFDYGNSPVEFSRLDLAGKSVILATTNGTRALAEVAGKAPAVLVGCLLNRTAVARAALQLAVQLSAGITVVCAGNAGSSGEDLVGAGVIIEAARQLQPGIDVTEAAQMALPVDDAERAIIGSRHAETLRSVGLAKDVVYCARLDVSDVVPALKRGADGLLVLRNWRPG